jgi:hypothetical protein
MAAVAAEDEAGVASPGAAPRAACDPNGAAQQLAPAAAAGGGDAGSTAVGERSAGSAAVGADGGQMADGGADETTEPGCLICMAAEASDATAIKGCGHEFW